MTVTILKGDCRSVLATLPDESVHCVVTSPPYWGLRDYGVAGQLGLEENFEDYVLGMREVFRGLHRVLRKDGTLWLNLGDSYCAAPPATKNAFRSSGLNGAQTSAKYRARLEGNNAQQWRSRDFGALKQKDLVGIPWRVAFALQADGWYLRQDIIWSKPNPMPESVRDRCTKAHEYLFLLSKSERYYYDADAIAEDVGNATLERNLYKRTGYAKEELKDCRVSYLNPKTTEFWDGQTRNRRSVWTVATAPFPDAHFATFPPALIEPCILAGCLKGGTVLDPFGGAGTTGLVADRLGRNAILIELNPEYADMAERRIRNDAGMFASVAAE